MGDRLRKSWCVWACIILEIVGAKIIGGNSSIFRDGSCGDFRIIYPPEISVF